MITVLHMNTETMPREVYLNLTVPCEEVERAERAKRAYANGHYEAVANIDSDDLERAYFWTNNIDSSWSRNPAPGVSVLRPLHHKDGQTYGLRSSMVGDLFILNGKFFVVDSFGFASIDEDEGAP
jgi:hypothetical protein